MPDLLDRLKTALADRYAIEREIGAGGMATVYLAEDLKHHRQVAVKVLRPELAAVVGAERFLNEMKVTANLQHPVPSRGGCNPTPQQPLAFRRCRGIMSLGAGSCKHPVSLCLGVRL